MKPRVLVADDERANRDLFQAMLRSFGLETEGAADGMEALDMLPRGFDLLLLDVAMPRMDGFRVLDRVRSLSDPAELPVIMVTGSCDQQERLRAVEAGANDFISKPVELAELRARVASQLALKASRDALKRYQGDLELLVRERTRQLTAALEEATLARRVAFDAQLETIHRLALAAEVKDPETAAHVRRVSAMCGLLARRAGIPGPEAELITHASPLHDVGKIAVATEILLKPGKLDPHEWEQMKTHTTVGAELLADSPSELLQMARVIALSHHEKWDGSGYPHGLAGDEIPLPGRICAVADVFDALTSRRPYKEAIPNDEAFGIIRDGRGSHFDPALVDLFFEITPEIPAIQQEHAGAWRRAAPARGASGGPTVS